MQAISCGPSLFLLLIVFSLISSTITIQPASEYVQTQQIEIMPQLQIQLSFTTLNTSSNQTVPTTQPIFINSTLNPHFEIPFIYRFSCECRNLYIIQQQYDKSIPNSANYQLAFYNYSASLNVSIYARNGSFSSPAQHICTYNQSSSQQKCIITVVSQCITGSQFYNATVVVQTLTGNMVVEFQYYFRCNFQDFKRHEPIQWGALIIAIFSVFLIFICSKFQQTRSQGNPLLFINYPIIIIFSSLSITRFILVYLNVPKNEEVFDIIYTFTSLVLGTLCIMVCFSQIAYSTKIKWLKLVFCKQKIKIKIRVMDMIGFVIGAGVMIGWFFSHSNCIYSNFIFVCLFVVWIKIIKFGSLKIVLVAFVCSITLSTVYILLTQLSRNSKGYIDSSNFNNPLFIVAPMINQIPNYSCNWYFIGDMAYPGMFLAFLQRFDRNKDSMIYSPTFLICYGLFSIVWFAVGSAVSFPLPYDIFTIPISVALLLLFANRRGQLHDLLQGRFFDQQKDYRKNQNQLIDYLNVQKTVSGIRKQNQMFQSLKIASDGSEASRYSQAMPRKAGFRLQQKHVYSQGNEQIVQNKKVSTNQAERDSEMINQNQKLSQTWTLKQKQ